MAVITTNLSCDLQEVVRVRYLKGNLFSQDSQANKLSIAVYDGGSPATISGTVTANIIREDGGTVTATGGTISGNIVSITLPAAAYIVPGLVSIVVKVTASSVVTTIAAVVANVYKSSTETAVDPGTIIPSVTALVSQIEAAVASIPADYSSLWTTLAPAFSSSASYTPGQYVTYNGGLYICTTAHTGSWSAGHFSAVTVGGELSRLNGAINVCEDELGVHLYREFVVNGTVPNLGNANAVSIADFVPAAKGDKVKISTSIPVKASGNKRVFYFYEFNQSGTRVKSYDSGATMVADEYIVSDATTVKVKWSILEADSSNNWVPLRKGDFDNYPVYVKVDKADKFKNQFNEYKNYTIPFFTKDISMTAGYGVNKNNGSLIEADNYSYCEIGVALIAGSTLTGYSGGADAYGLAFYDGEGKYISGFGNPVAQTYNWEISGTIPANAYTVKISCRSSHYDEFTLSYGWGTAQQNLEKNIKDTYLNGQSIEQINKKLPKVELPELRNGSAGNAVNVNAICTQYILPIDFMQDVITVEYLGDSSLANQYYWGYYLFHNATNGMTTNAAIADANVTKLSYNNNLDYVYDKPQFSKKTSDLVGYEHISIFLFRKLNGTFVPLRIATDQYSFRVSYSINEGVADYSDIDAVDTTHDLLYAKHAKGNTGTRLTLVHFSDLHKDTSALSRIMKDADAFDYDDAICTGDMVQNTYEQISSWWDASVLTCIGNHDTASYSSGTGYNWTALSMANRSAYYIEPFKSGWGITHTNGKSYYYKDYANAKVRLIVMDGMLYTDNGSDATAQTSWLEGLLASAITSNLHVLIAIHAPHGGAMPEECSFSRYNEIVMPTYPDCNTPQAVVDAVATKITGGLKFIGYIVGHTHQDNIWDAENDGKQLMYCITCATTSEIQWKNSDQYRDAENDAFNIIVIDTANTLVKIIRGGGANMDDHMRTRKAICFDYSTGTKVGEVL